MCVRRYGARRDLPTPSQGTLGDKPGTKLPNSSKGSAVDLTEEGWDYAFDIGLKSHFLAAKYAVPHMAQAGGGSIVNISSVHGMLSARNNLAYSSLKAGVLGLTRQMAVDFGPLGIRVNAILPGLIVKESNAAMSPAHEPQTPEQAERRAFMADQYPVRHYGEPIDIANGTWYQLVCLAQRRRQNLSIDGVTRCTLNVWVLQVCGFCALMKHRSSRVIHSTSTVV
eukprot:COSAG02_NODE_30_length_50867_cov_66.594331_33_plen_225_part_00